MSSTAAVAPEIQLIPTIKIVQVAGSNPRGTFSQDSEEFKQLKASIAERGIESPIKVGPAEVESGDERLHPVIYGHRRHAAALELGLDVVPAVVDDSLDAKGRYLAAIAENMDRADMSPLAEAHALRHLREHHGMKQAEAAKAMRMSERSARNREKLLEVGADVAEAIAAGEVPLEAIPHFAKISEASPAAPAAILDLLRSGKAKHGVRLDLLGDLAYVADALGQVAAKVGLQEIHDGWGESAPTSLPVSPEHKKELKQLHAELPKPPYTQKPGFRFDADDKKKAKAKGCLLELSYTPSWGGGKTSDSYIADGGLVYELALKKLTAMRESIEEELHAAGERKQAGAPAGGGEESQADQDRRKQAEREERKRKREEEMAEKANRELGEALQKLPNPKATDIDIVRLVCAMALGEEPGVHIEEGLGNLQPDTYAQLVGTDPDNESCEDRYSDQVVERELAEAKTAGECLRIVLRVAIAKQHHLPRRRGGMWPLPGPHNGDPLDVDDMLDDVAESLGVLSDLALKEVKRRRKAAEERAKRLESERAREAEDVEQRRKEREQEKKGGDRTSRALELIEKNPGITAAEIAEQMGIKPNFLYRILGDLDKQGKVEKEGREYTAVRGGG